MWKTILDLIFPLECLACRQPISANKAPLCSHCLEQILLSQGPLIKFTKQSALSGLISAVSYHSPLIRQILACYKYGFIKSLAQPLAWLIYQRIKQLKIVRADLIIPVPLHPRRLRWRGYNQSKLLAQALSQALELPVIDNLLLRHQSGLPQVEINNDQQRKENIKGAFSLNRSFQINLQNKVIFLIDDVSTSGATLEECSQVLQSLQPKEIWGLVVAKG